jgi:hypothetical protein
MTREEFVTAVTERIEHAIMRAQGIGDGILEDEEPREIAKGISWLLPSIAFEDEP